MRKVFVLAVLLSAVSLSSQDLHHSQFYTSPLNLNPGLTGIFNGDYRAAVNMRSQWSVNELVNYQTVAFNGDMKIQPRNPESKGFWSAGILFNYDQAGDSRLNLAHLGLSGSYTYALDTGHLITLGGLVGFAQRRFRTEDLLWDNNWTGNGVDPNLDPMEDFSNTSNSFLDLSTGVNYRWQKSTRTFINVGVGIFHLNRPDQTFFSQSASEVLDIRSTYSLFGSIQLLRSLDILLHGMHQIQGVYNQTLVGGYGRIHINQQRGKEFALLVGLSGRIDDSWIPKIAVELRNWYVGFSYDINVSDFDLATQNRGGPELAVIYRMTTVKPLPKFKNCPIF